MEEVASTGKPVRKPTTHRFTPCHTSDVPEGGAAETITQLLGQNFPKPIFHKPKSFCSSQDSFTYANSLLCCCFHRGDLHTFVPYAFFHRNPWVIQYIPIQCLGDVFLQGVGLLRTPPPAHTVSCGLFWFTHLLILFQSPFHKSRRQSATWGVCPSPSVLTFGQNRQCGAKAAQGKYCGVFLPSHQMLFSKWVCCHSNCQIPSVMPPLTSQLL